MRRFKVHRDVKSAHVNTPRFPSRVLLQLLRSEIFMRIIISVFLIRIGKQKLQMHSSRIQTLQNNKHKNNK